MTPAEATAVLREFHEILQWTTRAVPARVWPHDNDIFKAEPDPEFVKLLRPLFEELPNPVPFVVGGVPMFNACVEFPPDIFLNEPERSRKLLLYTLSNLVPAIHGSRGVFRIAPVCGISMNIQKLLGQEYWVESDNILNVSRIRLEPELLDELMELFDEALSLARESNRKAFRVALEVPSDD